MTEISLEADCANCAALCCLALAIDKGPRFAIDKPAGVACPNLDPDGRCSIHASLDQRGFSGCVQYTCHGAGQRVTQDVFAGKSWQQTPALMAPMSEAFAQMRQVHELLLLLSQAQKLSLPPEKQRKCEELRVALTPEDGWTQARLRDMAGSHISREAHVFFSSLRDNVKDRRGAQT